MQGGSCCHQGSLLKGTIYRTRSPRKMDASGSGAFPGPLVGCCLRRQNPATCSIGLQWRRQPQPLPGRLCLMKKQTVTPKSDRGLLFPTPPLPQYPARAPVGRLSRKERAYSSPKVETRFLRGKLCNRFCRGINYSPQGLLEKEKQIRRGGRCGGGGRPEPVLAVPSSDLFTAEQVFSDKSHRPKRHASWSRDFKDPH